MTIAFIAVPTAGATANGKLAEHFIRDVARLHEMMPDYTFLVPMIQDYALLPHMNVDATWEKWGHHCRRLIEVSRYVFVIKYPGWDTSIGVKGEVAHASEHNVQVIFINPLTLRIEF